MYIYLYLTIFIHLSVCSDSQKELLKLSAALQHCVPDLILCYLF